MPTVAAQGQLGQHLRGYTLFYANPSFTALMGVLNVSKYVFID